MNIIIFGPPGSGKGTQSDFLVSQYHFFHLSTGDLLRSEIARNSKIGELAKKYLDQGKLVPDQVMNEIIASNIASKQSNLILDGYPRTIAQFEFLKVVLAKKQQKIDLVLYLDINEKTLVTRLLARLICPVCKTSYNKIFLPPKVDSLCDKDQTKLIQRSDDSDEIKITNRLQEYKKLTQPLLNYFQDQKILAIVDANQSNQMIQQTLSTILNKVMKNG